MNFLTSNLRHLTVTLSCASMLLLNACSNTGSWQEEVKLSDGRTIVVTQKRRYEDVYDGSGSGNLPREFWLLFKLPELGDQEIVWHENLKPQVLNLHQGQLYVVGTPWTQLEYRQYGTPFPEYIPYRYEAGQWRRIPFGELPAAIYDTNLAIAMELPRGVKFVSLAMKLEELGNERIADRNKRISATAKSFN